MLINQFRKKGEKFKRLESVKAFTVRENDHLSGAERPPSK
jgi:hypothetical protein